jgi:hypothetical protein
LSKVVKETRKSTFCGALVLKLIIDIILLIWMLAYTCIFSGFQLGVWFQNLFQHLAKVPRYLIPSYFDAIITGAYVILRQQVFGLMSE